MKEQLSLFPPAGRLPLSALSPPAQPPAGSAEATALVVESGSAGTPPPSLRAARPILVNPHLAAARRLARKMRQLPPHSAEETRAGLAICELLKAFLQDEPNSNRLH